MELIVGENCYTNIEQANELISEYIISTNTLRKMWDELSDDDKKTIILSSTLKFDTDTMLYKGRKQNKNQYLQFPRIDNCGNIIECPKRVKLGLLIQGVKSIMIESASGTDYEILKSSGVKSFADGSGAKIEFANASDLVGSDNSKNDIGLYNDIFKQYFKEFTLYV